MSRYFADLHIHSRYSRATSGRMDLEHLAFWAGRKGIAVMGTGDCVHPGWLAALNEKLVPAAEGLYQLPGSDTRFMITGEIATIYKKGPRTRKVHHVVCLPDLAAAGRLSHQLARVGNIHSDGRPILGLDSRILLDMVLASGPGAFLFPAHIWTPWFSVLGAMSGFDDLAECYGDLADQVFAVETGLSSDPMMNWRVSSLDGRRLVSCSDAHSPDRIGREALVLEGTPSFPAIRRALQQGEGYVGTLEFFPEEGKYHWDGHRQCQVCWQPAETRRAGGLCSVCGKPVTVGVLHRVEELADRPEGYRPALAGECHFLVPLGEILAELLGCGVKTRKVSLAYERLLTLAPELSLLLTTPLEDLASHGPPGLAAGIGRMRQGEVIRVAGYDGEYGRIHLWPK